MKNQEGIAAGEHPLLITGRKGWGKRKRERLTF